MTEEMKGIDKNNKKKINSLIISLVAAFISTTIFHFKFGIGVYGFKPLLINSRYGFGYSAILLLVFLVTFTIMFLASKGILKIKVETEAEKEKRKGLWVEAIFLTIDLFMTGIFISWNWKQLTAIGLMWGIAEAAIFFAIVWIFFEFFHRFKFFPQKLISFFSEFAIKVCTPMIFLIIIMLGAYQTKYNYIDSLSSSIIASADTFANAMREGYLTLIFTLYHIGQNNPGLWSWLPIAALFIFTLLLLIKHFTKKEKKEEDMSAQELIDLVIKEEVDEQLYLAGKKKRPLAYNFFKKISNWMNKNDIEKEKKAKLEEDNKLYHIYDFKLTFKELKHG